MGEKGFKGWTVHESNLFASCNELIGRVAQRYGVDAEEILIGLAPVPPENGSCLVYVEMECFAPHIFMRKDMKAGGRWTRELLELG